MCTKQYPFKKKAGHKNSVHNLVLKDMMKEIVQNVKRFSVGERTTG